MDAMLNIIVVEDHDALREISVEALCEQGHHATGVDSAEALPHGLDMPLDVMVIDLNLPGEDGLSLARRVRAAKPLTKPPATKAVQTCTSPNPPRPKNWVQQFKRWRGGSTRRRGRGYG